jgi:hypothetical protein
MFQYRWVTVQRTIPKSNDTSRYDFIVSADEDCVPQSPTISYIQFATAASANRNILTENYGFTGYLSTLSKAAFQRQSTSFAFENSKNAIEDVLGLVSAIVVANLPLSPYSGVLADTNGTFDNKQPEVVFQATRVGTTSPWGMLLCLPPLLGAYLLGRLLVQSIKHPWKPGGDMYVFNHNRPDFFAGESIREILMIGRSTGRMTQATPLLSVDSERSGNQFTAKASSHFVFRMEPCSHIRRERIVRAGRLRPRTAWSRSARA